MVQPFSTLPLHQPRPLDEHIKWNTINSKYHIAAAVSIKIRHDTFTPEQPNEHSAKQLTHGYASHHPLDKIHF
jgi:hypothetical protein